MSIDESVLYFFNQTLANPVLDVIMSGITIWSLWFFPLAAICYYIWGNRRIGISIFLTLAAGFVMTFVFYYLAFRPRPVDVRMILSAPPFPSFPSGHATMAFGVATTWVLMLALGMGHGKEAGRGGLDQRWRINVKNVGLSVIILAYLFAGLIAVSRLYLGHHHPSDVVAGSILGCAIGAAIYGLMLVERTLVERIRWLLWPQVAFAILVTMMAYLDVLPRHLLRFPFADKVLHFLLFGAITFWLQLWLHNRRILLGKIGLPLSIMLPLTLALIEEGFQALSPLRTASLVDLAADAAGMYFFYLMAQKLISMNQTTQNQS